MQIIKKSSNGYQSFPLESMRFAQREIWLSEEITTDSAVRVLQQLLQLESEDERAPIRLIINSPGGAVNAGLMLYDQLKAMRAPVELYCVQMAASMAAVLLAGGARGRRFILPHSKVMLHEPLISSSSGGVSGSASTIQKTAESILQTKRTLTELLAQDTGRSIEEIEAATAFDNYMTAEEAIAFGLCDEIVARI